MFSGLKVVELASVLAGPSVGSFFAELGAKVVKIENPLSGGDITRTWKLKGENAKNTVSAYYAAANYHKKVKFLNLKETKDLKKLYREIKTADIVICNFKNGDDEKLKVDYNHLKKINPQLIYAQITGFGKESKRTAYDVVLQAESGFMFMNGTPQSGPVKMPVALIDILAAHQLKEGILCALMKRSANGEGALVSVSLYDAAISSLANQASNYLMENHIPQAIGTEHPNIAPYGEMFFTANNKKVVLAFGNDKQFNKFCDLINHEELKNDPRFKSNKGRVRNRKALAQYFGKAIANLHSSTIEMWIYDYDLPIGFVKNM